MTESSPQFIASDAYPPVLRPADLAEFLCMLTNVETQRRLGQVLTSRRVEFAEAVRSGARRLQEAALRGDMQGVFAEAHEIRGLAQTGGLTASGTIADLLCLYLHAARDKGGPDAGLVGLHVGAIARAAFAEDEATRLGGAVAEELGALVAKRLGSSVTLRYR